MPSKICKRNLPLPKKNGWPLIKAMLLNYPNDPTTWELEDQYMFEDDMLIAPIMEAYTKRREVYIPEGNLINYFTKEIYKGKQWIILEPGNCRELF